MLPIGQHDDCGLLAIRNATLDDSLNLDGLLSVVRPLQKDLEESIVSAETNFLEEGTGNFNGIGLMHYLESRGYACVLGRTHMSDLLELLCLSLTSRVVGVVWHEGSKTTGHWRVLVRVNHLLLLLSFQCSRGLFKPRHAFLKVCLFQAQGSSGLFPILRNLLPRESQLLARLV